MTAGRRGRAVSAAERSLWQAAMQDVKPLPTRPMLPAEPAPPPLVASAPNAVTPPSVPPPPTGSPPADFAVDRQSLRRLAKGDRRIDATIDLHGMTLVQAHAALGRFIAQQAAAEHRCLLVITGRGTVDRPSRLRREVPLWLAGLRPLVAGVAPAQARHGGDGALYVILRRRR